MLLASLLFSHQLLFHAPRVLRVVVCRHPRGTLSDRGRHARGRQFALRVPLGFMPRRGDASKPSNVSDDGSQPHLSFSWPEQASRLCWFHDQLDAWLTTAELGSGWTGWSVATASELSISSWQPWSAVSDHSKAPFVRWFCDAHTNAAFNELDRTALLGCAAEAAAFISEPPDAPPSVLRLRQLLVQSTLAASALRDELALGTSARIAIYMPNHPQVRCLIIALLLPG